jgi:NAD(P)-dependent dehydrogenase (short-subunit alcohol dehydrogenase family)
MAILDSFSLRDKVVVVTGASSGLGVAFARASAKAGADVVPAARREDKMRQTAVDVQTLEDHTVRFRQGGLDEWRGIVGPFIVRADVRHFAASGWSAAN